MKLLLFMLLSLATVNCAAQHGEYRATVHEVFTRAANGELVDDSLLIASYPQSAEQYHVLREVMHQVPDVAARDELIRRRIRSGSRSVLQAHLRYAAYVEGEEAMWYVEELDPMLQPVPFDVVCEEAAVVVRDVGRASLEHIDGLIKHCERVEVEQ